MDCFSNFKNINTVITHIRLYMNNIYAVKKFSYGTWTSRQHVFIEICTENNTGYGENIITVNKPDISLSEWEACLKTLCGKTVSEAFFFLRDKIGIWEDRLTELTEMSLVDLAGKETKQNALVMLNLAGRNPVHGVYVILSDDVDYVSNRAKWAVEHGRQRFIKVKLFGKNELDCNVIGAVRRHTGKENTFLIGDVNGGYRMHNDTATIAEIADNLANLYQEGLDACEDPAYISLDEWVTLQNACGELALIPDYPMRPAAKAIATIQKGMGRIYNIHPGCSGSIIDAIALAKKIRTLGAQLMIGDDSLVGPGCTIWQQLAVGLSADWVEATEKETESDFYLDAVLDIPTDSTKSPIAIDFSHTGFGLMLDSAKLAKSAAEVVEVF